MRAAIRTRWALPLVLVAVTAACARGGDGAVLPSTTAPARLAAIAAIRPGMCLSSLVADGSGRIGVVDCSVDQQLTVVASPMSGFPRRYPGRNTADGMYLDRCEPSFRAFVHEHHLADTSIVRSTVGATAEVWPHLLDRVPCVVSREA